jgi:hypothetical protein
MRIVALLLSAAFVPALLPGDTLTFDNGTVLDGTYLGGNRHRVVFQDLNGIRHLVPRDQIQTLNFGGYAIVSNGEANREAGEGFLETIPSGATITVQPAGFIASTQAGQAFPAILSQDVLDINGNVIIPAGSNCTLVARPMTTGGVAGMPVLGLDLQSVTMNGQRYFVTSSDLARNPSGLVLGNLVDGFGANVVTRGTEVMVPANMSLTFQLTAPLSLQSSLP